VHFTNESYARQQHITQALELVKGENLDLKAKVSTLEVELYEERTRQSTEFDKTLSVIKSQLESEFAERKAKVSEDLMREKDTVSKLTMQCSTLIERNEQLKADLDAKRQRINELEKDNIQQSKENYVLQNELDYEGLKTSQLYDRQIKIKSELKEKEGKSF